MDPISAETIVGYAMRQLSVNERYGRTRDQEPSNAVDMMRLRVRLRSWLPKDDE